MSFVGKYYHRNTHSHHRPRPKVWLRAFLEAALSLLFVLDSFFAFGAQVMDTWTDEQSWHHWISQAELSAICPMNGGRSCMQRGWQYIFMLQCQCCLWPSCWSCEEAMTCLAGQNHINIQSASQQRPLEFNVRYLWIYIIELSLSHSLWSIWTWRTSRLTVHYCPHLLVLHEQSPIDTASLSVYVLLVLLKNPTFIPNAFPLVWFWMSSGFSPFLAFCAALQNNQTSFWFAWFNSFVPYLKCSQLH